MNAPILKRLEALEAVGRGNERPLLLIVRFLVATEGESELRSIRAAPPHFPEPVDRLPGESPHAFKERLQGMLSHLPASKVVLVFERRVEQEG